MFEISRTSLLQTITPDHLLGRMNASMRFVRMTATLAGSLVAGLLGEALGLRPTLALAVVGSAVAVLWLVGLPEIAGGDRRGEATPGPTAAAVGK